MGERGGRVPFERSRRDESDGALASASPTKARMQSRHFDPRIQELTITPSLAALAPRYRSSLPLLALSLSSSMAGTDSRWQRRCYSSAAFTSILETCRPASKAAKKSSRHAAAALRVHDKFSYSCVLCKRMNVCDHANTELLRLPREQSLMYAAYL